jgi:filamentous hemagglutinin family protein
MKANLLFGFSRQAAMVFYSLLAWVVYLLPARANPTGGTVAQGAATFNTSGSQFTVNQTSANALINWQSFNIGSGETTTFNQPSATSVAWNQINDSGPSQISGNLNANGYVILQNQNGFSIGGSAVIDAHGLVLTTSPTAAPTLSSGGPWTFSSLPPAAKIVNCGQINLAGGGSAYLIASDIVNNGTISAPAGNIGLYAGQQVLLSRSPDGRGVNVKVTLPQGSVDNQGRLIADAGSIVAQAQTVNNNGLLQANSVQNNNGVIELLASDSANLGANSVISAKGAGAGASSGGMVTIKSDNTFSDQAGSTINIAGGAQGGNGGQAEISAPQMSAIHSAVQGQAAAGYVGGALTIDPANIWLAAAATDPSAPAGYTVIDVNSYSGLSAINVLADDNITLNTLWTLAGVSAPATLSLTATAGNITFNSGSGIVAPENAQNNWSINLSAGNTISLAANTKIQADAGRINLSAANVSLYGTLQANAIGQANGVIDVNASGNLTLGTTADIEAHGDNASANASPGGFVTLQAGSTYSDTSSSIINVAGSTGAGGGQAGIVEIFGNNLDGTVGTAGDANSIQSSFMVAPFALLINPYDLALSQNPTGTSIDANNNLDANFNLADLTAYTQIDFHALDNIELSAPWTLYATTTPAWLSLQTGNSIILDDGTSIKAVNFDANNNAAVNNWAVNLTAGTALTSAAGVTSGNDGIYLAGSASIQTQAGKINIAAANELQVGWQGSETWGMANLGLGSITTAAGGSINVTATYGDVNSGSKPGGYLFNQGPAPYHYKVSSSLGGISTAAGGDVSITAGGNVTSYLPTLGTVKTDAGSGAFGPQPGDVTIVAAGSVYGHFVEADGLGSITAKNGNAGAITVHTDSGNNTTANSTFALSLVNGSWDVEAPKGSIYLQEVRDPNGVFNSSGGGAHFFDYDAEASVSLNAGYAVAITGGNDMPRITGQVVPIVLPPTLDITAGAGGVTLYQNLTLFQSPEGNLNITTLGGGDLTGVPADGTNPQLYVSDSVSSQWSLQSNPLIFGRGQNSAPPVELNNPNPVVLNISGSLNTLDIYTTKATEITVGKDMINSSFVGENLLPRMSVPSAWADKYIIHLFSPSRN